VIMKMMLLLFLDKVRTAFRRGSEEFPESPAGRTIL
jgi:hypothetical protein